ALRRKAAGRSAAESRRHQRLSHLGGARCDGMQAIVTHFGLLLIRDSEPAPLSRFEALCSWRRRPLSQWTPARRLSPVVGISAAVRRACDHKSVEGHLVPNPDAPCAKKEKSAGKNSGGFDRSARVARPSISGTARSACPESSPGWAAGCVPHRRYW